MADSVSLGNAYVTIIPSMRGFEREMNKGLSGVDLTRTGKRLGASLGGSMATAVSDRLVHVGDGFISAGSRLADVGGRLTVGITAPLAGATAAVGTFALSTASAAETTEISFTTMLGSEEAALSMMEELADFAAHTPFELSGLQTATRQLLAYGFTAEDVIPMLTAVGDATAALGTGQAGIESVTRALGQMRTRGKVTAEEMLQLTEAGIPAWEYLARAIGTETAGAMDAVTKGAVSASEGIDAIVSGMETDFGGMMEEQSRTVEGLFSNLSDAIEQPLMKLRESDAYERFADSLADVVDAAGPFVESLLPHMERGLDAVSGVLDAATDAMDAFADMGEDGQEQLIGMATAAAAAGPALTVAGKGMQLLGSTTKGAGSLIQTGSKLVSGLGDKLLDFATAPETAGTALGRLAGAAASIPTPVTIAAGVIGGLAVTAIGAMAAEAAEAAEHEALLVDATRSASDIMAAASGSADGLGDAIGGIATDSEATLRALADLNSSVTETLGETAVDSARLDQYLATINELANQSGLTATEQYRLEEAVRGFNEVTGESYSVVDAASGKIADQNGVLQENTDQLNASAEAWRARAQSEALSNVATQYLEQEAQAAYDLKVAQDNLSAARERAAELAEIASGATGASADEMARAGQEADKLYRQIPDLEQEVDNLAAAHETAAQSASDFSSAAAIQSAVFSTLGDDAQDFTTQLGQTGLGLETFAGLTDEQLSGIAERWDGTTGSIFSAMSEMQVQIPAAGWSSMLGLDYALGEGGAQAINTALSVSGMTAQQFADKVDEYGITGNMSIVSFARAIAAGDSPEVAAQKARDTVGALSGVPAEMGAVGAEGSESFASGIGSAEGETGAAAGRLASAAGGMADVGDTWTWGYHAGSNFASGLRGAVDIVGSSAAFIAAQAAAYLRHSTPDVGPLSDDDVWGVHLGENLADGMLRALPDVERASEALAGAASVDAAGTFGARSMRAAPPRADGGSSGTDALLRQVVSLLSDIYGVIPEGMDGRTFGRAVRRAVAYGY